jgi:hypothetical protein
MDGNLDQNDCDALEDHLAECGECRETLAGLRDIVASARELGDIQPARDLWPGIAAAIVAPLKATGATVIQLPTAQPAQSARPGLFLSRPQLAAAATILMLISATATWVVGPGLAVQATPDTAGLPAGTPDVLFTSELPEVPVGLVEELRSLEAVLTDARSRLDANTIRIIEKNLAVIDGAIDDSRRALLVDPGNEFLEEHLARSWERRRDYLQGAVRVVEWTG